MQELTGKRVVIMGLGRFGGGVGAARYCARHGANVLVTDLLSEGELEASRARLADLPIEYRLGQHVDDDFASADIVVVNPAVDPQKNHFLHLAERSGAVLTTEIKLVIDRLPDRKRTIGVTGTAGKSTTVAMIGHILSTVIGPDHVHVGGNIGGSLLDKVDDIASGDWVVLELSSFMLEHLAEWSPHVAVVTSLGDNHLDRHGSVDAYVKAKKNLLRWQGHDDRCVLGPTVAEWRYVTPAITVVESEPADMTLRIPGDHNRLNAAMAIATAECAGVTHGQAVEALKRFSGLSHRLQLVADCAGVRWYNDSKSTTPESAMIALDSFEPGICHMILGGSDKRADMTPLAKYAARRAARVYTIGQLGPVIGDAVEAETDHCPVRRCGILDVAVADAAKAASMGQVVLLSPGCASFDQFENFEQRGDAFADLVLQETRRSCENG